ncbi:MAG: hypothetical protein KFW21_00500 [Spirochaetota bacterium]|nr:hypothetical protein [Spirochaetota bacterium]
MTSIISYYFSTLLKHFFVLLFFCSSIPLILFALNYSEELVLFVLRDVILLSIPWFLWFHQALFCGMNTPRTISSRLLLIITSTILSTLLLMISFPFSQKNFDISITNIKPNITIPNNSIISTSQGTLVIDPQKLPKQQTLFSQNKTKALWIGSNYLLFDNIKTNKNSFTLSNPQSFSSFGYYKQSGSKIIPFELTHLSIPQYKLGQQLIQRWFDNMSILHTKIRNLYITVGIKLPTNSNTVLKDIVVSSDNTKETSSTNDDPMLISYKKASLSSRKLLLSQSKYVKISQTIKTQMFDYTNIFLTILCIFSIASFLGVVVTIAQQFLGALAIILILSIYTPYLSTYIINISLELYKNNPNSPILLINFLLVIVLYTCIIIATTIKNITKGIHY